MRNAGGGGAIRLMRNAGGGGAIRLMRNAGGGGAIRLMRNAGGGGAIRLMMNAGGGGAIRLMMNDEITYTVIHTQTRGRQTFEHEVPCLIFLVNHCSSKPLPHTPPHLQLFKCMLYLCSTYRAKYTPHQFRASLGWAVTPGDRFTFLPQSFKTEFNILIFARMPKPFKQWQLKIVKERIEKLNNLSFSCSSENTSLKEDVPTTFWKHLQSSPVVLHNLIHACNTKYICAIKYIVADL